MKVYTDCSWIIVWLPTLAKKPSIVRKLETKPFRKNCYVSSTPKRPSVKEIAQKFDDEGHDNPGFDTNEASRECAKQSITYEKNATLKWDVESIENLETHEIDNSSLNSDELELKVENLLETFQIDAKMTRSYDNYIKYCFMLENFKVQDLILQLQTIGVGSTSRTSVSVIPASLHFEMPSAQHFITRYCQLLF